MQHQQGTCASEVTQFPFKRRHILREPKVRAIPAEVVRVPAPNASRASRFRKTSVSREEFAEHRVRARAVVVKARLITRNRGL